MPHGDNKQTGIWRQALKRLTAVENRWEDDAARRQGLLECRHWMEEQTGTPRLSRLAALLRPDITPRQFLSVLVPVERVAARGRVTDEQILDHYLPDDSAPKTAVRMPLVIVADSLRSAFNSGGIFRTADCFGADAVWLCGYTASPPHPHVARAALGADAMVPWRAFDHTADALRELLTGGSTIIALETVDGAPDLADFQWPFPAALLLGNERFGLSTDLLSLCDHCIRIPVFGRKNSLNVVSAAAIALHHARCAWEART